MAIKMTIYARNQSLKTIKVLVKLPAKGNLEATSPRNDIKIRVSKMAISEVLIQIPWLSATVKLTIH